MKKIVVKIGTSTLTLGGKKLQTRSMVELTRQLSLLHDKGCQLIVVTSGAVAAGREQLRNLLTERTLPTKQMFAATGQIHLMQLWAEMFALYDIHVGQLLLTRADLSDRKRYLNARDTVNCLLRHRVVPIINENDPLATETIRVGDNDNLAALLANLIAADLLILLTDQEGLYTTDPRHDPSATLIQRIDKVDGAHLAAAKGSGSTLGTGGMATKVEAALKAAQCGTPTVIASASHPEVLLKLASGNKVGTYFATAITPQESKKRWLLSEKPQGQLAVDGGAATKIQSHGASLLPSGIVHCKGVFERGDIVAIVDAENNTVAVGMSNYNSEEITKLIGSRSDQIITHLGYSYSDEVVHRSNMTRVKT